MPAPVLLVCPPFSPLDAPSLGLALLQGCLAQEGVDCEVLHLHLDFAACAGQGEVQLVNEGLPFTPDLAGDWVFAEALNGAPGDIDGYFEQVIGGGHPDHRKPLGLRCDDPADLRRRLLALRALAGPFLDRAAARILAGRPRVLGISSVFAQTAAALALAKRVKAQDPSILVVLGGASAEGCMGEALFGAYPFLDAVVSGEGERRLPPLVHARLEGRPLPRLDGVTIRSGLAEAGPCRAVPAVDLGSLPTPDYRDWFRQRQAAGVTLQPRLLVETSRGCWWGERQHCTFCGLNGHSLGFRAKPAARILAELHELQARHPGCVFGVTDNILGRQAWQDLLPALAELPDPPRCFYEVKANLDRDQLALLKAAGCYGLQPGIESLSDPVLVLMRKGLRALQAVQLLRHCRELGLDVGWNLLGGFPGEDPAEYARMADLLPLLSHLQPPALASRLRLDRFSPLQEQAEAMGLREVHAVPAYHHVYGLPQGVLDRLAYFLRFDHADGRDPEAYLAGLEAAVARWKSEPGSLVALAQGERVLVFDGRACATASLHVLEGAEARLLRAATALSTLARLRAATGEGFEEALASLRDRQLILVQDGFGLALPLDAGAAEPGSLAAAGIGESTGPMDRPATSRAFTGRSLP